MLPTVFHDVFRQGRTQSAHIGEQMLACGVQVHAYGVHAALHGQVEAVFQLALVHVVLVLSHTDALRVDFHQFGQGVHQSAPDAHRATHRHVLVGEFLAGGLRCRIDRGTVLAHHEGLHLVLEVEVFHEFRGLAAGSSIADGDGLDAVVLHHLLHVYGGLHTMVDGRVGEDGLVV